MNCTSGLWIGFFKIFKKVNLYNQDKLIEYFKEFKINRNIKNSNVFWQAICMENFQETLIRKNNFLRQAKFLTS